MIQPPVRTLLRSALAAGGAGALALGVPGVASAQVSGNFWAGYVAASSTYTSVTATWAQPMLTCGSSDSEVGFWVGLDGYGDSTVEQAGTEAACVDGTLEYEAWYEMYPAAPVYLDEVVSPGDIVTATVSSTAAGVFTLTIKDTTSGWIHTARATEASAPRSSAEVAMEVPSTGGIAPSPGGSVTFTGAKANGAALGAANPTLISGTYADCGPIVGGTKFTCTWG